jgi:hypothetical protein
MNLEFRPRRASFIFICFISFMISNGQWASAEDHHTQHYSQTTAFAITTSTYNAEESQLYIEGVGAGRRKKVTIQYLDTGKTIGSTYSQRDGGFIFSESDIQLTSCDLSVVRYDGAKITISVCDGSNDTSSSTGTGTGAGPSTGGSYALLAWNDLGMHCMDGLDYSVFSILPPFNNLHAQLIQKDSSPPQLIADGVTLTYAATAYPDGAINTTSAAPSNFWDYVSLLYGPLFGPAPGVDIGLLGNPVQSRTPAPMTFNASNGWWEAEGIPTDPYDDDGAKDFYPLVKVTASDLSGNVLATTTTVLPVSDEMDCRLCHASGSVAAAEPTEGWVANPDAEKDYKLNILRLHDDRIDLTGQLAALSQKGYTYGRSLYETALNGTPILCSACHVSNALPGTGIDGVKPLTEAIHGFHAQVTDPTTGQRMNDITNRSSCYHCHPGAETQCLRGAMGAAVNPDGTNEMACQSCHGKMSDVGTPGRLGWLMEPSCQECHFNGQRSLSVQFTTATDTRFATNPDTPTTGLDLFRYSKGHGGIQCEACHGTTHAIYPSTEPGDNMQSMAVQGHAGTIAECASCHAAVPFTSAGGPHGLHTIGQTWVNGHEHYASGNSSQCTACHGSDYRGSALSEVAMARTFTIEGRTVSFREGHLVSCYDCHNGPGGGD